MVITKIVEAAAHTIKAAYPEATVRMEPVRQGMHPPEFLIEIIDVNKDERTNNTYTIQADLAIHYFPKSVTASQYEMFSVADGLAALLRIVKDVDGQKYRGFNMAWSAANNVLTVLISYTISIRTVEESDNMEVLTHETKTE